MFLTPTLATIAASLWAGSPAPTYASRVPAEARQQSDEACKTAVCSGLLAQIRVNLHLAGATSMRRSSSRVDLSSAAWSSAPSRAQPRQRCLNDARRYRLWL